MTQFPHIHLNGTSAEGLKLPIREAYCAIGKAIDKMRDVTPHGRDYYTISANAISIAYAEHTERVSKLEKVRGELLSIYLDIERQEKERAR